MRQTAAQNPPRRARTRPLALHGHASAESRRWVWAMGSISTSRGAACTSMRNRKHVLGVQGKTTAGRISPHEDGASQPDTLAAGHPL